MSDRFGSVDGAGEFGEPAAGLLDRRPVFYAVHIAVGLLTVAACWTAFVLLGDSWWQLFTAVFWPWRSRRTGSLLTMPFPIPARQ